MRIDEPRDPLAPAPDHETPQEDAAHQIGGALPAAKGISRTLPRSRFLEGPELTVGAAELTSQIVSHVKRVYPGQDVLHYHGFMHAFEVEKTALVLAESAARAGIEIDRIALSHAALLHDAMFAVEHELLGESSKEELSAHYAYRLLKKLGATEEHARKVESIILATHFAVRPETPEQILLRAADLNNLQLFEKHEIFLEHTRNLWSEQQHLRGVEIPFSEFVEASVQFLPLYVFRMLELTPAARNERGASVWHQGTAANLLRLYADTHGGRGNINVIAVFSDNGDFQPLKDRLAKRENFLIAVAPDELTREQLLLDAQRAQAGAAAKSPFLALPGSSTSAPLEDSCCDEVHVADPDQRAREEALRILRPGGKLVAYNKGTRVESVKE